MRDQPVFKIVLLVLIILAIAGFYFLGGDKYLSLGYVQTHLQEVRQHFARQPIKIAFIFFAINASLISLSIPGGIVLTLLSGAIFGVGIGTALVVTSATVGATLSFLMSRYILREWISKKFHRTYQKINQKINVEGRSYLLVLRMIPVSPFIVVNNVMGLTSMKLLPYMLITCLGMLPGTLVYVYAGQKISQISEVSQILSLPIILSLSLVGLLPVVAKKLTTLYRKKQGLEVSL